MADTGVTLDKDAVREVLRWLVTRQWERYELGDVALEQATNQVMAMQRPPSDIEAVALTVVCDYCGRTAGNRCRRKGAAVDAHPSRIAKALSKSANG